MVTRDRDWVRLLSGVAVVVSLWGCSSDDGGGVKRPIERGGHYVLELGDLYFEVDPAGARVIDVHLPGSANLLTGTSVDSLGYGSTFWTSPQSTWGWPPPAEIDTNSYTATVASRSVSFVGKTNDLVGASVSKRFTADQARSRITATYDITAQGGDRMLAPWEITRVFPREVSRFFQPGSVRRSPVGALAFPPRRTRPVAPGISIPAPPRGPTKSCWSTAPGAGSPTSRATPSS